MCATGHARVRERVRRSDKGRKLTCSSAVLQKGTQMCVCACAAVRFQRGFSDVVLCRAAQRAECVPSHAGTEGAALDQAGAATAGQLCSCDLCSPASCSSKSRTCRQAGSRQRHGGRGAWAACHARSDTPTAGAAAHNLDRRPPLPSFFLNKKGLPLSLPQGCALPRDSQGRSSRRTPGPRLTSRSCSAAA